MLVNQGRAPFQAFLLHLNQKGLSEVLSWGQTGLTDPDGKSSQPREKMVRRQAAKTRCWPFRKSTINQSLQGYHVSQTPAPESLGGPGLHDRRPPLSQPVCCREEDQYVGCPLPPRKLSCCLMRFNSPSKGVPGPNICLIKEVRVLETQKLFSAPPFSGFYCSQNPFH